MKAKFMLAMQGASAYVNMTDSFLEKAAGTLTGLSTLSLHAAYLDLTRYPPRSEHVCTPHLRLRPGSRPQRHLDVRAEGVAAGGGDHGELLRPAGRHQRGVRARGRQGQMAQQLPCTAVLAGDSKGEQRLAGASRG